MHIEFLIEEVSTEAALQILLPRILNAAVTFDLHAFQGKTDLMRNLPQRLQGYRNWLPDDWRVVVLLDRDNDDCHELKQQIDQFARAAGLTIRSTVDVGASFQVLNRIVIEELEAWFFGDTDAIAAAYPRFDPNIRHRAPYRNPDAIAGGTWEALERELRRRGYHMGGLAKTQAARDIATHMQPERNHSQSFQAFRQGLLSLIEHQ
jgi:hypothetical protein